MMRGIFDSMIKTQGYSDVPKQWYVELQEIDQYWYDLIINEHEKFATKDLIRSKLKNKNDRVKESSEKRFIYFIASRKKVRFSKSKKPRYSLFGKKIYLYLEIGKEKTKKRISLPVMPPGVDRLSKPKVEVTPEYITITDDSDKKFEYSVHDFLDIHNINLGIDTFVQYVGQTKNPEKRPLDGAHSGLSEILYKLTEEYDILIFINLFKVIVLAENKQSNIQYVVANSMTDEIDVQTEGDILEKCLILYFLSKNQIKNREKEKGELKNNLMKIACENNINAISVNYGVEGNSEYHRFGSTYVEPKRDHFFRFSIENGALSKKDYPDFHV